MTSHSRIEPAFLSKDGDISGSRGSGTEIHLHVHQGHGLGSDWKPLVMAIVLISIVLIAILAAIRWYQIRTIESAFRDITSVSTNAMRQAQDETRAREERERQRRADQIVAQQVALETQQAQMAREHALAAREEAAWSRFYKPSPSCANPDSRATIECANEHIRAKREFNRRWQAGEL